MKKKIPSSSKPAFKLMLLALLLFPILSWAQKNKSLKPVNGYYEASYTLSTSEQYMSAWLVAGPVPVGAGGENPTEETQISFFKEDIQPVTVVASKPIVPLEFKGKQYAWELVRTSTDVIDLDGRYSGADFAAAFALAEI